MSVTGADGTASVTDHAAGRDVLAERVLDGAERAFSRFGVRACTMDNIAREAAVSRVTVYRHVGPKDEVFRQVVLRNSRRYYTLLESDFLDETGLADIVRAVFTRAQAGYRGNQLYRTLLELEPDTVLRTLTTEASGFYVQGVPFLAPYLKPYLKTTAKAEIGAEWIIRVAISIVGTTGHLLDPYVADDLERLVALTTDGLVRCSG